MTKTMYGRFGLALVAGLLASAANSAQATKQAASKDIGPANAACDTFDKGSISWIACVGKANASLKGDEAFYAGYWLAKSGNYRDALSYLRVAPQEDARVLTYIGFATRKLGDVEGALPYYDRALSLNPNYSVARAYLGEAFLSRGEPAKAQSELEEIGRRCGRSCAEYADLARHIAAYKG
jgi:tetratricopeptide (TPR) repeat protein